MAGPEIANAKVQVDLDGSRIPAEARVLGEEAGREMGDATGDEFNDRASRGVEEFGEDAKRDLAEHGRDGGEAFGDGFNDRARLGFDDTRRDADLFGDDAVRDLRRSGLLSGDGFRDGLRLGLDDIAGDVGRLDDDFDLLADHSGRFTEPGRLRGLSEFRGTLGELIPDLHEIDDGFVRAGGHAGLLGDPENLRGIAEFRRALDDTLGEAKLLDGGLIRLGGHINLADGSALRGLEEFRGGLGRILTPAEQLERDLGDLDSRTKSFTGPTALRGLVNLQRGLGDIVPNARLLDDNFTRLYGHSHLLGDAEALKGMTSFGRGLEDIIPHARRLDGELTELRNGFHLGDALALNGIEEFSRSLEDLVPPANRARGALGLVRAPLLGDPSLLRGIEQFTRNLSGIVGPAGLADRAIQDINPHARLLGDPALLNGIGGFARNLRSIVPASQLVRGGLRDLGGETENLVGGAERAGAGLERLGSRAVTANGKTGGLLKTIKSLAGATRGFDPADNMGQLFLLILAFAGPLAVLISALGAQIVILGTAAAAAGVGLAGLIVAFIGLTGKFGELAPGVRAAQDAFKALAPDAKQLGLTLTNDTFKNLAGPFKDLGAALPKLNPALGAIGKALGSVIGTVSTGLATHMKDLGDLFIGFAPIIKNVGDAAFDLTGVFGGLFKAATPFAQVFTKDLDNTIKKWSDWINSIQGQKALTKWFQDAQPVMKALGDALGGLGKGFDNLITPSTTQDLLKILSDIGKLGGLFGNIGAALSPVAGAISDLLVLIGQIIQVFDPVISAVGVFAAQVVAFLTPVVNFFNVIAPALFAPLLTSITLISDLFKASSSVAGAYFDGLSTAVKPLVGFISDAYGALRDFVEKGLKIAQPAFDALGASFKAVGGAIGLLLTGFGQAAAGTDAMKGGAKGVSDFLNGPFKGAVDNVTGFLKQLTGYIQNSVVPGIKELDWSKVTKGLDELAKGIPPIIDALVRIGVALVANVSAFGAWANALFTIIGGVVASLQAQGKVVSDVMHGDFVSAAKDGVDAFKTVGSAAGAVKTAISNAMSASGNAIDSTGKAAVHLGADATELNTRIKTAFADFSKAGDGNLSTLASKMGLTGDKATAFRTVIEDAAKKSGVSLSNLADAKSLPDLENRLGVTGAAAKSKFEAAITAAAGTSGNAIDKLPPKVQAVIGKMEQLDGQKANPHIGITGDTAAISAVDSVRNALNAINGKTSTVSIITRQVGQGTAGGAIGGIVAGGHYVAGARAFASGGIVNSPTWLSPFALTGESGAEAIVPLARPLNQIDPSVRNLAAYAQGLDATTDKVKGGTTVMSGAIQIISPAADPAIVATQALDRLVPLL